MNFLRSLFRIPLNTYLQIFYFGLVHIYRFAWNILYKHVFHPLEEIANQYSKKEPNEKEWLEVYKLNTVECNTNMGIPSRFYSSEEYYFYPHTDNFEQFLETEYPECLSRISEPAQYDTELDQIPNTLETLFIAKNEDKYLFRSFPLQTPISKSFSMKDVVVSEVEFIIAEYTHPKMSKPITLDIPKGYYLVGNELFSPAFVQRYLELQKEYYVFDDQYIINILDHEVNEHKITFDQYIKLDEKSYLVYNISDSHSLQIQTSSDYDSNNSSENKMTISTTTTDQSYHLDFSDASDTSNEENKSEQSNTDQDDLSSDEDREDVITWWKQYIQVFT